MNSEQKRKYASLQTLLQEMGSVLIGYSGGVDSTFLMKVAHDTLGERALAVTAISEIVPEQELKESRQYASQLGFKIETVYTNELKKPEFKKNTPLRCAYCKAILIDHLRDIAQDREIQHIALGVNTDDLGDYRPGQDIAKEKGVRFPLVEANMSKEDIRAISKTLNIPTWDKPAFACLASRLPYGETITAEKLKRIGKAEQVLRDAGFKQYRVRYHKDVARIEIPPEDMPRLLEIRESVVSKIKEAGFAYIAMDLLGYRSGSMNETLKKKPTLDASDKIGSSDTVRKSGTKADAIIDPERLYTAHCDGGSRGNPGPAAYGAVILDESGGQVASLSKYIGKATNNVAEYEGLIGVLSKARDLGVKKISVKMDSQLIVRQIKGEYRVKQPHLVPLFMKCKAILRAFDQWKIEHVRRESNTEADRLANDALDNHA